MSRPGPEDPPEAAPIGKQQADHDGLIPVLETFDETLLAVVRSVLEESQIPFVVRGHGAAGLDGLVRRVAGMFSERAVGIRILVPVERAEEAAALLSAVDGSFPDVPELADEDDDDDDSEDREVHP